MSNIYFIRHGETDYNSKGIIQSNLELELNEIGSKQIQVIAKILENCLSKNYKLFTSDNLRSTMSARIIGTTLKIDPIETIELREVNFGKWTGKKVEDLRSKNDEQLAWDNMLPDYIWEGGESFRQAFERANNFLQKLLLEESNNDIIIVGHGFLTQIIISSWIFGNLKYANKFSIYNGSISLIDYPIGGLPKLIYLNFVPWVNNKK